MRKLIMVIVCLVIAAMAYAQGNVRQIALNEFKSTLIAPSQFVLTDIHGNRISTSQIKATYCKEKILYDTVRCYYHEKGLDSIIVYKETYPACYKVTIIGDARNRAGGYEQMIEYVYVCNGQGHIGRPNYKKALRTFIGKSATSSNDLKMAFDVVEEMPQYPGGPNAMFEFLEKNIKYPAVAEENCIQGRVIVSFVVNENGSIDEARVVKSVESTIDREAMRLVMSMPHWIPGKQNGKAVKVNYTVPVTFRLK